MDIAIPAFLSLIEYCQGALPAEAQAFLRVRPELVLPLAFRGFLSAQVTDLLSLEWNTVQAGNIPCRRNLETFSVGFAHPNKGNA